MWSWEEFVRLCKMASSLFVYSNERVHYTAPQKSFAFPHSVTFLSTAAPALFTLLSNTLEIDFYVSLVLPADLFDEFPIGFFLMLLDPPAQL